MNDRLEFTRYTNARGLLTKRLGPDGSVIETAAAMTEGWAERVTVDWAGFASALDAVESNQAFGYGGFADSLGEKVRVITKKAMANYGSGASGAITRSGDYLAFGRGPGILMLDCDLPGIEPEFLIGVLGRLFHRGLTVKGSVPYIYRKSVSGKGFHLYLPVTCAATIPEFKDILEIRLWNEGHGRVICASNGALLRRTLVDMAVFSPERLDFVAPPVNGGRVETVMWLGGGEFLDLSQISILKLSERTKFERYLKALKEAAKPESVRVAESFKVSRPELGAVIGGVWGEREIELPITGFLDFVNHGRVEISEVLSDVTGKYDKEPCADPIEGVDYGVDTAMFFANRDTGIPRINSFAHGGCQYVIKCDKEFEISNSHDIDTYESPEVVLEDGDLLHFAEVAEKALMASGTRVYQMSGRLVRPIRVGGEGVRLIDVDMAWLRGVLSKLVIWKKPEAKRMVRVACPKEVVDTLLAGVGSWRFLELAGLVNHPVVLPSGGVVSESGYDAIMGSRLFLDYQGADIPWDFGWCRESAVAAVMEPFKEFPFVGTADRAVALSALLTGLMRRVLRTAPVHCFDASTRGSGKSLLADVVSAILTGSGCATVTYCRREEENQKVLSSLMLKGCGIISIDNIEIPFGDEFLKQIITSKKVEFRVLGESRTVRVDTNLLIMANGNNLRVKDDFTRRVLVGRLDPGVEHPEDLVFEKPNLVGLLEGNSSWRAKILSAACWLLQESLKFQTSCNINFEEQNNMGSFEEWSRTVRACCVWMEIGDPAGNRDRVESRDPVKELLVDLYRIIDKMTGSCGFPLKTREILELGVGGRPEGCISRFIGDVHLQERLKDALVEFVPGVTRFEDIKTRSLGMALSRREGEVVDGLRLRSVIHGHEKVRLWSVAPIES